MKTLNLSLQHLPKFAVILVLIGGVVVTVGGLGKPNQADTSSTAPGLTVAVVEPAAYSALARNGMALFDQFCAACHGVSATGTGSGPPLVHDIYNPGHHADEAFIRAARNGVPAHHWPYGNMPPVDGVGAVQVRAITSYIRELQVANGITWQPHNM